jgi:uncharacterized membrane protein
MSRFEESITVDAPVRVAYDQWTQFEEFPQFMEGIVAVRQLDDSHVRWIAEIDGERQEWDAEIVEQEPDRVIAWRSTNGLPNNGRVEFLPIADGTRVTVAMEYEPEGIQETVGAALGIDGAQVAEDLERFKDLVEGREVPTGSWRGEIQSGDVVGDDPGR